MQNDTLKNRIVPWQEKGRWYHAVLTSDGTAWTIDATKTDPFITTTGEIRSGNYFHPTMDTNYRYIDVQFLFSNPVAAAPLTIKSAYFNIYLGSTKESIIISPASTYVGDVEVWVFMVNYV